MKNNDQLIKSMIESGVLETKSIINAFKNVDRKNFCVDEHKELAYIDKPLPILSEQTISQPTTVAIMTGAVSPSKGDKVLEIGTGSGYQAAIISEIVKPGKVYTIERIKELIKFAKKNLEKYENVEVIYKDGSEGLKEKAPFDCIIVTAGAPEVPNILKEQLRVGGKLIAPVGKNIYTQRMKLITRKEDGFEEEDLGPFAFVPLIGKYGFKE